MNEFLKNLEFVPKENVYLVCSREINEENGFIVDEKVLAEARSFSDAKNIILNISGYNNDNNIQYYYKPFNNVSVDLSSIKNCTSIIGAPKELNIDKIISRGYRSSYLELLTEQDYKNGVVYIRDIDSFYKVNELIEKGFTTIDCEFGLHGLINIRDLKK